jgi:hypothetical protein
MGTDMASTAAHDVEGKLEITLGVERVDGFLQIDAEGLLRIQRPGDADQALRKIGIDAPVAHSVGIGQRNGEPPPN